MLESRLAGRKGVCVCAIVCVCLCVLSAQWVEITITTEAPLPPPYQFLLHQLSTKYLYVCFIKRASLAFISEKQRGLEELHRCLDLKPAS